MSMPSFLPQNLLPASYRAFIAGGYAACPELAMDCDVWVTVPVGTLVEARTVLLNHLTQQGFTFEPCDSGRRSTEAGDPAYDLNTVTIDKVAIIAASLQGRSCPIHLLLTDGDVDDVLEGFDISTHQCALTAKGGDRLHTGNDWTPLTEEPYVIRMTEPTRARLDKIRARYAHLRPKETDGNTF